MADDGKYMVIVSGPYVQGGTAKRGPYSHDVAKKMADLAKKRGNAKVKIEKV